MTTKDDEMVEYGYRYRMDEMADCCFPYYCKTLAECCSAANAHTEPRAWNVVHILSSKVVTTMSSPTSTVNHTSPKAKIFDRWENHNKVVALMVECFQALEPDAFVTPDEAERMQVKLMIVSRMLSEMHHPIDDMWPSATYQMFGS